MNIVIIERSLFCSYVRLGSILFARNGMIQQIEQLVVKGYWAVRDGGPHCK